MLLNIPDNVLSLLYAIAVAVVFSLEQYFNQTPKENFSWALFAKTVLLGILIGYAETELNMSYDQAFLWATTLIPIIDKYFLNPIAKTQITLTLKAQPTGAAPTPG